MIDFCSSLFVLASRRIHASFFPTTELPSLPTDACSASNLGAKCASTAFEIVSSCCDDRLDTSMTDETLLL